MCAPRCTGEKNKKTNKNTDARRKQYWSILKVRERQAKKRVTWKKTKQIQNGREKCTHTHRAYTTNRRDYLTRLNEKFVCTIALWVNGTIETYMCVEEYWYCCCSCLVVMIAAVVVVSWVLFYFLSLSLLRSLLSLCSCVWILFFFFLNIIIHMSVRLDHCCVLIFLCEMLASRMLSTGSQVFFHLVFWCVCVCIHLLSLTLSLGVSSFSFVFVFILWHFRCLYSILLLFVI